MIGRIVSHHQITDQLGAGGMGVVYRPRDLTLGRDVALKLLPGTMLADPEAVPNFARKVRKDGGSWHYWSTMV
jgi:serine/threonine-protein kinase